MKTPLPRRAPSYRASIALAGLLLALSLGLPWGVAVSQRSVFHPPRPTPAPLLCHSEWDAVGNSQLICAPDFPATGWVDTRQTETVVLGASHVSRFGVVAGLALLALGWRGQHRRYLLLAGGVVAISTVLTAGLGAGSAGSGAAWLAVVILLMSGMGRWQRAPRQQALLSLSPPAHPPSS